MEKYMLSLVTLDLHVLGKGAFIFYLEKLFIITNNGRLVYLVMFFYTLKSCLKFTVHTHFIMGILRAWYDPNLSLSVRC
jgi:hypothetical protein